MPEPAAANVSAIPHAVGGPEGARPLLSISDHPPQELPRTRARDWLGWLVAPALLGLVLIAFMPALSALFVHWDDDDLLFNETRYRVLTVDSLRWMFTTTYTGHWQPLTWLSYSLDWQLWNIEPFGYHLTNLLLHAVSAVLVYRIASRLIVAGGAGVAGAPGERSAHGAAWAAGFAAAIFAVHPLRVESVAWLAERRDCLSGVFYFAAVLCYLRYVQSRAHGRGRPAAGYAAAVALFGLSLLAKASAVVLPIVLLILDVYPLRRYPVAAAARKEVPDAGRASAGRLLFEKLPFLILGLAAGVMAVIAQSRQGATYTYAEYGLVPRLAQAVHGLSFYIVKTMWPTNLGPLYPLAPISNLFGWSLLANGLVVAAVLAIGVVCRRRLPAVTAALAVYAVHIFPVLGFVQSGPQRVADRYSYLACTGFSVLAAAALWKLYHTHAIGRNREGRSAILLLATMIAVTLSHLTFRQADVWTWSLTLWARGVQVAPNSSIARTNYGDALVAAGLHVAAVEEYRKALRLNPRDVVALRHLADVLGVLGAHEQARAIYVQAIELDPDFVPAYRELAEEMLALDRPGEAADVLRHGLAKGPEPASIRLLAGLLSAHPDPAVRNPQEAEALARWLLANARGRDPLALMLLATALGNQQRFAESVEVAQAALRAARRAHDDRLVTEIERRLARFCLGRTYYRTDP